MNESIYLSNNLNVSKQTEQTPHRKKQTIRLTSKPVNEDGNHLKYWPIFWLSDKILKLCPFSK